MNNLDSIMITISRESDIKLVEIELFHSHVSINFDMTINHDINKFINSIVDTINRLGYRYIKTQLFLNMYNYHCCENNKLNKCSKYISNIMDLFGLNRTIDMFEYKNSFKINIKIRKLYFIINGYGGVGKDIFVNLCAEEGKNRSIIVENYSSIDPFKKSLSSFGIDISNKTDKLRKLLSDFKQLVDNYNDFSTNYLLNCIDKGLYKHISDVFTFCHIREPFNINKLKADNRFDFITILVTNDNCDPIESNDSDKNVNEYNYDIIINNEYPENINLGDYANIMMKSNTITFKI